MKRTSRTYIKSAVMALGALALWVPDTQGGTFPLTLTNAALGSNPVTFTVIEADGFNAGGTAGNTVQIADPATEFSNVGGVQNFWHWRDFAGMNLKGTGNPGDVDLLETTPARTPQDLRTTISGLPANSYEVYLVTLHNTDGTAVGVLADLESASVTIPTTLRLGLLNGIQTGTLVNGVWSVDLVPLGQVTGTGFNLLVGSSPDVVRGDYIGVAYVPAGAARIYASPTAQTVFASGSVSLAGAAFGNPEPTYQWLKNGAPIAGATDTTLNLNTVTTADAGLYSLRASNPGGTNVSAAASVNVVTALGGTKAVIAVGTNSPLTYVQADAFLFGGTPGNTVAVTNPTVEFAVEGAQIGGYWNYRDFGGLDMFGLNTGDPDLLEADSVATGQTLRTTISGLTEAIYEVYVVQTYNSGGVGILADIETGSTTNATTLRQRNSSTIRTGIGIQNMAWEVDLQPVGQVSGSGFSLLVGPASGVSRSDYLGVAYRLASPSPVSIITQPATQVAFARSNVTFSVSTLGNPLPKFQWRKNGLDIAGATVSSYSIGSASSSDAGLYSVRVTNTLGVAVSSNALLNVFSTTGPTTIDITVGTNATFHFVLPDPFVDGGTSGNTVRADGSGTFFAKVGAAAGLWNSRDFASLDMFGIGNPAGVDLLEVGTSNAGAPLRTSITGLPEGDYEVYLVHQYRSDNGENVGLLADLATPGLAIAKTRRARDAYSVLTGKKASVFEVILSPLGQVHGTGFDVLVGYDGANRGDYVGLAYRPTLANAAVTVVGSPTGGFAYAGGTNIFTVSALGSAPLSYQWKKNGVDVPGASERVLALSGVQTADAGLYSCAVSNSLGGAISTAATLNIFAPLGDRTMDITVGANQTVRFVPVDAYTNGGIVGNTISLTNPTAPFALVNLGTTSGMWNYRDFASLDLYSPGTSASLDLLETASGNFTGIPTLQTTLTGLPPGTYDVFLVHNWRPDGGEQPGFRADIQTGELTDPTTVRRQTVNFANTLRTGKTASVFEVVLQPLGQVTGTNISVLLKPIDPTSRGDYYGLGYRSVGSPVLTLSKVGGIHQITWSGSGTLQVADAVTGPYVDIAPVAASPYVLGTTGAGKFYRLKR
jgi:hypothetical protein